MDGADARGAGRGRRVPVSAPTRRTSTVIPGSVSPGRSGHQHRPRGRASRASRTGNPISGRRPKFCAGRASSRRTSRLDRIELRGARARGAARGVCDMLLPDDRLASASRLRRVCRRRCSFRELRAQQAAWPADARRGLAVAHRNRARADRPGLRPRRERSGRDHAVREADADDPRLRRSLSRPAARPPGREPPRGDGPFARAVGANRVRAQSPRPRLPGHQSQAQARDVRGARGRGLHARRAARRAGGARSRHLRIQLLPSPFRAGLQSHPVHARGPADREDRERLDRLDALRRA